jgi:hypothetical protein
MKKRLLQIGSLLMALAVLFVSVGWDVKFHYCTEDHHMTGSLGNASDDCVHCWDHHHEHEMEAALPHDVMQFDAKCCCDDFDSKIQFTDNFVFSSDRQLDIHFQPFAFLHLDLQELLPKAQQAWHYFTARKIPHFFSARDRLVYFSALRLNPLVF